MEKELLVATNVKQALTLKNEKSVFLAGGTEINRLDSSVKYESLISLKKLGLNYIFEDSKYINIGSMCTFQELIDSKKTPSYLKKACTFMGSRTKRNMATIGGNIALRRFDSYLIPTLVVAQAKLLLQNSCAGDQEVDILEYIENKDQYVNSLIQTICLPKDNYFIRSKRCANTVLSHAFITVAASYDGKNFNIYAGLKNSGFVKFNALSMVLSKKSRVSVNNIIELVKTSTETEFYDDIFGSVDYKLYILGESIYELYSELKGVSI